MLSYWPPTVSFFYLPRLFISHLVFSFFLHHLCVPSHPIKPNAAFSCLHLSFILFLCTPRFIPQSVYYSLPPWSSWRCVHQHLEKQGHFVTTGAQSIPNPLHSLLPSPSPLSLSLSLPLSLSLSVPLPLSPPLCVFAVVEVRLHSE